MGADTACTIRVRKFLTNRLLGRKQFVSFRASPRLCFLRFGVVLVQHGLRCLVLPVRVSACCGWGRRGGHTARFRRKQLATYRGDRGGDGPKIATRIRRGGVSGQLEMPQPGVGRSRCKYAMRLLQCAKPMPVFGQHEGQSESRGRPTLYRRSDPFSRTRMALSAAYARTALVFSESRGGNRVLGD
jgi:hypothetical protein